MAATETPPDPENEKAARQDRSLGAQKKEDGVQITHTAEKVKWAFHAHCFWLEFLNAGDRRHLIAFRRHRAAMGGRMRGRVL